MTVREEQAVVVSFLSNPKKYLPSPPSLVLDADSLMLMERESTARALAKLQLVAGPGPEDQHQGPAEEDTTIATFDESSSFYVDEPSSGGMSACHDIAESKDDDFSETSCCVEDRHCDILVTSQEATDAPRSSSSSSLRPIIRVQYDADRFVKTKRGSWRCLPPPDLAALRRITHSSPSVLSQPTQPSTTGGLLRKSVSFGDVNIRCYDQTIGDNPSVSYGPPISLDWKYNENDPISVDEYEGGFCGRKRRTPSQMILNHYNRKHLLMYKFGYSEQELKQAENTANRCKRERALTRALLPALKLEDVLQSAARKAKRSGLLPTSTATTKQQQQQQQRSPPAQPESDSSSTTAVVPREASEVSVIEC